MSAHRSVFFFKKKYWRASGVLFIRLVQWLGWVFETQERKKERGKNPKKERKKERKGPQ